MRLAARSVERLAATLADAAAWARAAAAVGRRPRLWPTALVQARRLAPDGWWRRPPFLPLPDRAWLAFRLKTAYGDGRRVPPPGDVVAWLSWCRTWDHLSYPRHR